MSTGQSAEEEEVAEESHGDGGDGALGEVDFLMHGYTGVPSADSTRMCDSSKCLSSSWRSASRRPQHVKLEH
jgi:hypothetical protein